jgi:hypothetical protein
MLLSITRVKPDGFYRHLRDSDTAREGRRSR